jgi:1-acyl-sn-glycerol-3-phosphate acyltransferase
MLAREQTSILIDDRLFKVPIFGRYLHRTGHIPVVPERGRLAYDAGKQLLQAGRTLAVFPEGSVSPLEGGLYPPRTGVARLALETGVPVIPVGIHLDRKRIRLVETEIEDKTVTGTWYLGGPYAMTVGEPMRFTGSVQDRPHVRAISEQIMRRIARLAQESATRMERTEGARAATGRPRLDPLSENFG